MRQSIISAFGRRWVRWTLLLLAGALAIAGVGLLVFQVLPDQFAPQHAPGFGIAAEAKARADVRTSALQLVGGIVIAIGAVLTARTVHLTQERNRIERESQITERFTRAIDQLGSGELDVRLGGIYALERIARDSRADHWTIMEVLTAFVREHAPLQPGSSPPAQPTTDVQAVLTVLGRRRADPDDRRPLDLRGVDVQGAQLNGAHMMDAWLAGARLADAQLTEADLRGADLSAVDLERAFLLQAKLNKAILLGAHLSGAILSQADLSGAHLFGARLAGTRLVGAILVGANIMGADLSGASLQGADLREADLSSAHLHGTDLYEANLEGASFDDKTTWPDGFDPLVRGARPANAPTPS